MFQPQQPPVSNQDLNDLFNDPSTVPSTNWMKFINIGDAIQGVLVDEPQYNVPGKFGPQNIYNLETAEGDMVFVPINPNSNKRAVMQLKQAEVGDIVAIKFVSTYDSGKGNPGKNLEVRIRKANAPASAPAATKPAATFRPAFQQPQDPATALARIIQIAKQKLHATSDDDAKIKVMEATNIPVIESRYKEILGVMEAMNNV